jgi:hypothetical protein
MDLGDLFETHPMSSESKKNGVSENQKKCLAGLSKKVGFNKNLEINVDQIEEEYNKQNNPICTNAFNNSQELQQNQK